MGPFCLDHFVGNKMGQRGCHEVVSHMDVAKQQTGRTKCARRAGTRDDV